ncbi:MAG: phage major capsid protein [Chloroflexota bacterium]|nr:MAG: phage major capsid protein [Chloroflexota bacterium]
MKTIAEKILAKQERLVQIKDRLTELKNIAEADDGDLSEEEQGELTILADETETTAKSIEALQKIEIGLAAKSLPASGKPTSVPRAKGPEADNKKGNGLLVKLATAKIIGHHRGVHPRQVIADDYGNDEEIRAVADFVAKTAVDPATTTEAGWAAELVQDDLQGFLYDMQPISLYASLRAIGMPLEFGGANSITIPRRAAGGPSAPLNDVRGSWVGEGGVIPVKRIQLGSQTLNRYKTAVISTFTQEILEQSTPSIEVIVRQSILDDTSIALDNSLVDDSAIIAGVRPAGLMLGVTPTASAGDTAADIITDLKVLFSAMTSANLGARPALMMHPNRVLGLSTVTIASGEFLFKDEVASGTLLGVPLIVSANMPEDEVMIVDASSFASANDTPDFKVSDQATLTMANADGTAPTQAESSATPGDIGTAEQVPPGDGIDVHMAATTHNAGYEAVSMYQTYSTALRMILPTTWGLVRPGAVAALSGVSW